MNNNCLLTGNKTTNNARFKSAGGAFEKTSDHLVNVITRKHSKVDRRVVADITAKEVKEALTKKKLFGTKELTELENKIYGKVLFEMQLYSNISTVASNLKEKTEGGSNISEYAEHLVQ